MPGYCSHTAAVPAPPPPWRCHVGAAHPERNESMPPPPVHCGCDVGGTLTKVVLLLPEQEQQSAKAPSSASAAQSDSDDEQTEHKASSESSRMRWDDDLRLRVNGGGVLVFSKFLTRKLMAGTGAALGVLPAGSRVDATGGGVHKLKERSFAQSLGVESDVHTHDELDCLVRGLQAMRNVEGECFALKNILFHGATGHDREILQTTPVRLGPDFLLVNIGSGISFVQVQGASFERVGGSSLGGSTFLGLAALLTGVDHFDTAIEMAARGDSAKVDMLVRDIYGSKEVYGLKGSTLAASFGKMINKEGRAKVCKEDLVLSALIMLSMNVASLAHLHAKLSDDRSHHTMKHIVFTGSFLATSGKAFARRSEAQSSSSELHLHKRNAIAMRTLAYAVAFWSAGAGGERTACFQKHDGYLGAIGALCHAGVPIATSTSARL